jgi:hypothetical protein
MLEKLLSHLLGGNGRHASYRAPMRCSWVEIPDPCLLLLTLQEMALDLEIGETGSALVQGCPHGLKAKADPLTILIATAH